MLSRPPARELIPWLIAKVHLSGLKNFYLAFESVLTDLSY
jgi:hypothetical protein